MNIFRDFPVISTGKRLEEVWRSEKGNLLAFIILAGEIFPESYGNSGGNNIIS